MAIDDDRPTRPIANEPPDVPPPAGVNGSRRAVEPITPHDPAIEAGLLGIALLNPDVGAPEVAALNPDRHFYLPAHILVAAAIQELHGRGDPIDAHLVSHHLAGQHLLEKAGGAARIVELLSHAPISTVAPAYAQRLRDLGVARAVHTKADAAARAARNGDTAEALAYLAEIESDDLAAADLDDSLQPVDLEPIVDGTSHQPTPDQLVRHDGHALFYAGGVNGIHGGSGEGKGWLICHLIAQNAAVGRRTMLVDLEDTADSIVARLQLLGMTAHDILNRLVYLRPQVPFTADVIAHLTGLVASLNVATIVIDSLGEAFALEGLNEDKDVEVGPWYRRAARPLADTGAAVVIVDHSTKAADNPLHPSGSKRKRAAITGASYLVEAVSPFVKDQGGRLRVTCAKDRHGNYRRGEQVADLVMTSNPSSVRLDLYAPLVPSEADVPTLLAAKAAVAAAAAEDQPIGLNALVGLMKVKAGTPTKRGGIELAVARGALTETAGPRKARLFEYAHDLEEPS